MASSDLTAASLAAALVRDDVEAVIALFRGATDRQRSPLRTQTTIDLWSDDVSAARAAAWLATARASEVADWISWRLDRRDAATVDAFIAVLLDRTDRFRASVSKATLTGNRGWWWHWEGLRRLVLAGVVDPMAGDATYIRALGMQLGSKAGVDFDVDPALLEREVWRLFEVPEVLLGWSDGVAAIAEPGRVDRDRLVDASLASLAMDRRVADRRIMAQIATELALTDAELAARSEAVLGLCIGDPGTQLLAMAWLKRLLAARAVDVADATEALRAPLTGAKKNLAVAALKLLDQIACDHPEAATGALVVAASGLGHPQADVAIRTLKLLERRVDRPPDPELTAELLAWIDVAPVAHRPAIAGLCGVQDLARAPSDQPLVAIPEPRQPWLEARYAPERAIEPIDDFDELVLVMARLLESEGTGDDLERAIVAVGRLADQRPPGFDDLVSPIAKRARSILEADYLRSSAAGDIAQLSLAWTKAAALPQRKVLPVLAEEQSTMARLLKAPLEPRPTISWLTGDRIRELAVPVAARTSVTLWSEPTHQGGHLDPSVLAERSRTTTALGPADARMALLRAGRGSGTEALLAVTDVTWPHWFVAAGSAPGDPLAARAVDISTEGDPTRFRYPPKTWWDVNRELDAEVAAGILCTRLDLVAAFAAVEVGDKLRTTPATADPGRALELLADPVVPFDGPMATLVALSLGASPRSRAVATDVLIAVIDDGRIDPALLAGQLAVMQERELVVLARITPPLTEAASAGPVHRAVSLDILLRTVVEVGIGASGLHALLEAAVQLTGTSALTLSADQRALLDRLATRTSKAAKAARSLLASAD